jgi:hypothetical protein
MKEQLKKFKPLVAKRDAIERLSFFLFGMFILSFFPIVEILIANTGPFALLNIYVSSGETLGKLIIFFLALNGALKLRKTKGSKQLKVWINIIIYSMILGVILDLVFFLSYYTLPEGFFFLFKEIIHLSTLGITYSTIKILQLENPSSPFNKVLHITERVLFYVGAIRLFQLLLFVAFVVDISYFKLGDGVLDILILPTIYSFWQLKSILGPYINEHYNKHIMKIKKAKIEMARKGVN